MTSVDSAADDALPTLVARAQRGEAAAFEQLVMRHIDRVSSTARLLLQDRVAADDAVQEALLAAWRGIGSLRRSEAFPSWIRELTVRACVNVLRKRTGRRIVSVGARMVVADFGDEVAVRHDLVEALNCLTPDHRAVIVLRFYADMTISEIAGALRVREGTVKSRLHYALADLRSRADAAGRVPVAGHRR